MADAIALTTLIFGCWSSEYGNLCPVSDGPCPGPPQACKSLLVDASTLGTIHRAVLMLSIDSSKVIELRDWITPDRLPAFLPVRRTYLPVLILRRHRVSVIHPKNIMVGHSR